jgi:hypothetical protein
MSEVTYYVALPFVAADDGVAAGEAVKCFNPNAEALLRKPPPLRQQCLLRPRQHERKPQRHRMKLRRRQMRPGLRMRFHCSSRLRQTIKSPRPTEVRHVAQLRTPSSAVFRPVTYHLGSRNARRLDGSLRPQRGASKR